MRRLSILFVSIVVVGLTAAAGVALFHHFYGFGEPQKGSPARPVTPALSGGQVLLGIVYPAPPFHAKPPENWHNTQGLMIQLPYIRDLTPVQVCMVMRAVFIRISDSSLDTEPITVDKLLAGTYAVGYAFVDAIKQDPFIVKDSDVAITIDDTVRKYLWDTTNKMNQTWMNNRTEFVMFMTDVEETDFYFVYYDNPNVNRREVMFLLHHNVLPLKNQKFEHAHMGALNAPINFRSNQTVPMTVEIIDNYDARAPRNDIITRQVKFK